MKKVRYIIVLLFSLLIIFAGAGVAVIHCYCVGCRVTHECCDSDHDHNQKSASHHFADFTQEEECCTTTVYKINLLKNTEVIPVVEPLTQQLSGLLAKLLTPLPAETLQTYFFEYPPSPPDSRLYLALYSVLII